MPAPLDDLPATELRFHFNGGRPSLDFVATLGERWRRAFERLREPEDLGRWLVEAGILERAPRVTSRQLNEARELREAIYRIAKPAGNGRPSPAAAGVVNRFAARPAIAPQLDPGGRTASRIAARPVEAALSELARDAIGLVTGPLASRVRECAAPDCSLLFVDASRPGARRWCSMEACGNRAKTAAYRRRLRSPSGRGSR